MRAVLSASCLCLFLLSAYATEFVSSDDQILWVQTTILGELIWAKAEGITVDDSGVYIVGSDNLPAYLDPEWRIEKRSRGDGSLIWSRTENITSGIESALAATVDSSGLYIVGYAPYPNWRIEKRNPADGSLIWKQTENFSGYLYDSEMVSMYIVADQTGIYICGSDASSDYYQIEKRNLEGGSLIWNQTRPLTGDDRIHGIAVDSSGLYIVGDVWSESQLALEWRIEKRSLTDGALIWSQISEFRASYNHAYGAASDGSGLYVAGYVESSVSGYRGWRIERRNPTDGSIVWYQTDDSIQASAFHHNLVVVDASGVYVAGFARFGGREGWVVQKRSLTDGSLVGVHTKIFDSVLGMSGVAIDSSGLYLVSDSWRIEKWSISLPPPIIVTFDADTGQIGFDYAMYSGKSYNSGDTLIAFPGSYYHIMAYPGSGHIFARWETTGGISVENPDWSSTNCMVSASGTLRMVQTPIATPTPTETPPPSPSVTPPPPVRYRSIPTSTGSGSVAITISDGDLTEATGMHESYFPTGGRPNLLFPHGFFSFRITNLPTGGSVTIELELPSSLPVGSQYWMYGPTPSDSNNHWYQLPMDDDDGDNLITVTIVDGGLGDDDLTANGVIVDPGGPAVFESTPAETPTPTPTPTESPTTTPTVQPSSQRGCVIATASYGSELASEVVFMRQVRDQMVGSNQVGRTLVDGWNAFYYLWSPPVADAISSSEMLRAVFRTLLLPLILMIHLTALIHTAIAPLDSAIASLATFIFAAAFSIATYFVMPIVLLLRIRSFVKRR